MKWFNDAFALIIGIGTYSTKSNSLRGGLTDIPAVKEDVSAIYKLITSPYKCAFPKENVIKLVDKDATIKNIRDSFKLISKSSKETSTILIYFSGHGGRMMNGNDNSAFLCPIDSNPMDFRNTTITQNELSRTIASLSAKKVVLFIDACHSAGTVVFKSANSAVYLKSGLPDNFYDILNQGAGRIIIASSREDQISYIRSENDFSVFTYYLLEGLDGKAAVRGDNYIRILDLFHFISNEIRRERKDQTPILKATDLDNNFVIALNKGRGESKKIVRQDEINEIRESIIRDPIRGAEQLSYFLEMKKQYDKKNEVDLQRSVLLKLKKTSELFGLTMDNNFEKNRIIFYLLQMCNHANI